MEKQTIAQKRNETVREYWKRLGRTQAISEFKEKLENRLCFRECGKCGHESYGKFVHDEDIEEVFKCMNKTAQEMKA
jgi:hypothetical protein